MKNRMILAFIILGICAVIIIINLAIVYTKHLNLSQYDVSGMLPSTYVIPSEDSNLIAKKYWEMLTVDEVYQSKQRGAITNLLFDKKYRLAIYKIDLGTTYKFKDSFHVQSKSVDQTIGVDYRITGNSFFYILYKGGNISPVSQIYLTLGGDSLQTIINNDSLICYHLSCQNFSIRYSEKEPIDIYFEAKEDFNDGQYKSTSLDILFLKRNNVVYLLAMAPIIPKASIAPEFLNNIIIGK